MSVIRSRFVFFVGLSLVPGVGVTSHAREGKQVVAPRLLPDVTISIPEPLFPLAAVTVEPKSPLKLHPDLDGGFTLRPGYGLHFVAPPVRRHENPWLLLQDPLPILGAAYVHAESVEVCVLCPYVHVKDFPDGHFGDFVREGWFVMRKASSDEGRDLHAIFDALAEGLLEMDSRELAFVSAEGTKESLEEYARRSYFQPTLFFRFLGRDSISVLIDTRNECAIVRKADRIGSYDVRPVAVPTLELLTAQFGEPTRE